MMTDPISDMLARIRNAIIARHERTEIPLSSVKKNIAEILKREGFIEDYSVSSDTHPKMTIALKYGANRKAAIVGLRRKSRPGRRLYVGYEAIPKVQNGVGVAILSTSQGLMTDKQAREKRVGGEILCEVW
jgi:small subunit ribosomal protein S8